MLKHSSQLADRTPQNPVPVQKIISVSAAVFGISSSMMTQRRKLSAVIKPKHVSITITRYYLGYSLLDTAEFFGLVNHASVIHACKRVQDSFATNRPFRQKVLQVINELELPEHEACIYMNLKALVK